MKTLQELTVQKINDLKSIAVVAKLYNAPNSKKFAGVIVTTVMHENHDGYTMEISRPYTDRCLRLAFDAPLASNQQSKLAEQIKNKAFDAISRVAAINFESEKIRDGFTTVLNKLAQTN